MLGAINSQISGISSREIPVTSKNSEYHKTSLPLATPVLSHHAPSTSTEQSIHEAQANMTRAEQLNIALAQKKFIYHLLVVGEGLIEVGIAGYNRNNNLFSELALTLSLYKLAFNAMDLAASYITKKGWDQGQLPFKADGVAIIVNEAAKIVGVSVNNVKHVATVASAAIRGVLNASVFWLNKLPNIKWSGMSIAVLLATGVLPQAKDYANIQKMITNNQLTTACKENATRAQQLGIELNKKEFVKKLLGFSIGLTWLGISSFNKGNSPVGDLILTLSLYSFQLKAIDFAASYIKMKGWDNGQLPAKVDGVSLIIGELLKITGVPVEKIKGAAAVATETITELLGASLFWLGNIPNQWPQTLSVMTIAKILMTGLLPQIRSAIALQEMYLSNS